MNRALWACILAGSALGCASAPTPPPADLLAARAALRRAELSSSAELALPDLREAKDALADAEDAHRASPGADASFDAAYLARRKAERARIAGLYAADLEALETARRTAARLRVNLDRRDAAAETREREAVEEERERERARAELATALEDWKGKDGEVRHDEDEIVLVLPAASFFELGTTKLRGACKQRVTAFVEAFRDGPPARIIIRVTADAGGKGTDPALFAKRRAALLRDTLIQRGIGLDLIDIEGQHGDSATVELVLREVPMAAPTARLQVPR